MLLKNEIWGLMLDQHMLLHSNLGAKSMALRTQETNGLELSSLTLIEMSLLHEPFALRTPLASNAVGPKTLPAVEALVAFFTTELKEKQKSSIHTTTINHTFFQHNNPTFFQPNLLRTFLSQISLKFTYTKRLHSLYKINLKPIYIKSIKIISNFKHLIMTKRN